MAQYQSSQSVNPKVTPYAQRLDSGSVTNWANKYFGSKPYEGRQAQRTAPRNIYGGAGDHSINASAGMGTIVHGANLQPDIPGQLKRPMNRAYVAPPPMQRATVSAPAQAPSPVTNTTAPQQAQSTTTTTQPPSPPKHGDAYQFIDAAGNAVKIGDGGVHDQSVDTGIQKVKSDYQRYQNAENPDAVREDIENDPWYASNSLWKGIFSAAAAAASGANPMQAYQAGLTGIQQGEEEDTRNSLRENAVKNRDQLLQMYTPDSVAAYELTGDQAQLRERKLTQAEQDARAAAATQDERAYEQSKWERDRNAKFEDEQRKTQEEAKKPEYAYDKGIGIWDKKTGKPLETPGVAISKGSLVPAPEDVDDQTADFASRAGYYKDQLGNYKQYDNKKGQWVLVNNKQAIEQLKANDPDTLSTNMEQYDSFMNQITDFGGGTVSEKDSGGKPYTYTENGITVNVPKYEIKEVSEGIKDVGGMSAKLPSYLPSTQDNIEKYKKINNELVLEARKVIQGQGPITDKDQDMLESAKAMKGKSEDQIRKNIEDLGNLILRKKAIAQAKRDRIMNTIYPSQNRGALANGGEGNQPQSSGYDFSDSSKW